MISQARPSAGSGFMVSAQVELQITAGLKPGVSGARRVTADAVLIQIAFVSPLPSWPNTYTSAKTGSFQGPSCNSRQSGATSVLLLRAHERALASTEVDYFRFAIYEMDPMEKSACATSYFYLH